MRTLFFSFLSITILLISAAWQFPSDPNSAEPSYFDAMEVPFKIISIAEIQKATAKGLAGFSKYLKHEHAMSSVTPKTFLQIGENDISFGRSKEVYHFENDLRNEWISIVPNLEKVEFENVWKQTYQSVSPYTGMDNTGQSYVYIKRDARTFSTVNVTFRSDNSIFNMGIQLPILLPMKFEEMNAEERAIYAEAMQNLTRKCMALVNYLG